MGVRSPSYQAGFYAPERGGRPAYPQAWRGCVGAWNPGLGPSGLVLRDWGGRKNHGTLTNGPVWSTSTGRQALSLDGVNDFVGGTAPQIIGISQSTMAFWLRIVNLSTGDVNQTPVRFGPVNANGARRVDIQQNGAINSDYYLEGTLSSAAGEVVAGTWYHIATTQTATTQAIYKNGKLLASTARTPSVIASGLYQIGRRTPSVGYTYPVNGQMDDVRVYNRALPADEVNLLAQRPGIAYELAPRRFISLPSPSFSAAWALRQSIIIGGGLQ